MPTAADQQATYFTIGELARELDTTTRTIRYYEERGLISPQRTEGQQRIYTTKERGRLKLLLRVRGMGFKLDEVQEIIDIYDAQPDQAGEQMQFIRFRALIERRLAQLDEQMQQLADVQTTLRQRLADVDAAIQDTERWQD